MTTQKEIQEEIQVKNFLSLIVAEIARHKGANIRLFDMRGSSSLTDYFLIAEGNVPQHVKALCRAISKMTRRSRKRKVQIEQDIEGKWIVMDYSHVMIHLMTQEMSAYYQMEQIWTEIGREQNVQSIKLPEQEILSL